MVKTSICLGGQHETFQRIPIGYHVRSTSICYQLARHSQFPMEWSGILGSDCSLRGCIVLHGCIRVSFILGVGLMPVQSCQSNGKPGFRWGQRGKCYTYTPGNKESMERARNRAQEQGRAIEASQKRRGDEVH